MRLRLAAPLLLGALGALARTAAAQESLDDLDKAAAATGEGKAGGETLQQATTRVAEVNGYAANRFQYSHINPQTTPAPTADQPSIVDLLEANVQLKVRLGSLASVYGDVSLLLQAGGLYYESDGMGGRRRVDEHYVAALQPFVATNELYVQVSPAPWLSLLAGKKRIVWGSGMAFNPTDLVNPPKDPTDPNFQRAGAWLARVELPFEKFTVSALFAPSVLYSSSGLPSAVLQYPSYALPGTTADTDSHYLVGARLYALLWNTDINAFYYFSNKFRDGFENKSRFGLSLSRYFFTDYELHVEALFQTGSARTYVNHACVADDGGLGTPGCTDPRSLFSASKLTDGSFVPRILFGGRTQFGDESTLSLEYYYQGDGYTDAEFDDALRGILLARKAAMLGLDPGGASSGNGAVPLRFSFDPLRQHYLIASWMKPKIHDDWTVSVVLIAGLRDLSGMVSPTVSWNVREWLTLSLYAFVPIRGIPVGQSTPNASDGKSYNEYSLLPFDVRGMFEARAYY